MHKIQLSYALQAERSAAPSHGSTLIRNPLMDLLHAVREQGSISKASKALDLSYRHVWGLLKSWEVTLGRALIVWDKGQHARLTEFGDKLLWAERQAQARLAPQIEALRGDIERAFSCCFDDNAHVLTLFASHDTALSALREQTAAQGLHLDIRFTGSVDAIAALNAGRCMMAGFHTADQPGRASQAAQAYRHLLKPGQHKLIGFAHRTQGLIVARGNPLRIKTLLDATRHGVRFVNRAEGTGTRVLLADLLASAGIRADMLNGYDSHEPSHTAVAQSIAAGKADVGLGIATAADQLGLGFVPLVRERYHLVCLKSELPSPPVQALLAALQSQAWQTLLTDLPGYDGHQAQSGKVLPLSSMLPWWQYRTPKRPV
jgi:putative molybdopterin biosynthesis protein